MNWKQYRNTPYEVSDQGEVRRDGRVLACHVNQGGYRQLSLSVNTVRTTALVHRMVAETFIPNPAGKPQVNHIDGDKLNNDVSNLEWCTAGENIRHALETGLRVMPAGEDASNARLTADQVLEIRRRYADGSTQSDLSAEFGVGQPSIHRIVSGKEWMSVGGPITDGSERRSRGSNHHRATVTEDQVREIRSLHGTMKRKELAERFGITECAVKKILSRQTWKHL